MTQFNGNGFQILKTLNNDYRAFAHEILTVGGTVVKLTIPTGARYALINVESSATGKAIRFWLDGSAPTTTNGLFKANNEAFDITEFSNLENFKAIQAQAGTHKLMVQYFS